jgi:hypothetical protein
MKAVSGGHISLRLLEVLLICAAAPKAVLRTMTNIAKNVTIAILKCL